MPYEEERMELNHHLILEDREKLTVSGVEEVESFDENTIVMDTAQGVLVVRGEELQIEKLSLDGGDLKVEGMIESLVYEAPRRGKGGVLPVVQVSERGAGGGGGGVGGVACATRGGGRGGGGRQRF